MRAKNLLVTLVSTLLGLLLWEVGLRSFTHYGPRGAALPASVAAKPVSPEPDEMLDPSLEELVHGEAP